MGDGARIAADLRAAIDEGAALFHGASEDATARPPRAGAWSPRQIVGHLIDSACNNHRRFIINQDAERLVVDSYVQDVWVSRQRYAETPASDLVTLWTAYNTHLARVIEAIPDDILNRLRGPAADATLRYLAEDYVRHLRHHLSQIRGLLQSA
jgi:hypothetical protein